MKGSLILGLESTWQRAAYLARQEIYFDEPFTLEETLAGIDAVTVDDVGRVASRPAHADAVVAWRCVGDGGRVDDHADELQVAS